MTTGNAYLAGMKPSPLMVRILSAAVFLGLVLAGVYAGIYGVYALVLILGGLALWEFLGLSEGMGSRAPITVGRSQWIGISRRVDEILGRKGEV